MARKLNKKFLVFLVLLTVVVVGGLLGVFGVQKLRGRNPERYIKLADAARDAGNYVEEARQLGNAVARSKGDAALRVRAGDVNLKTFATEGRNATQRAFSYWRDALEIEPNNVEALDRLVNFLSTLTRGNAQSPNLAENLGELRQYSGRLANLQPDNVEVAIIYHMVPLNSQMIGLAVSAEQVSESVAALRALTEKHPENAELLFNLGRFNLFTAMSLTTDERETHVAELLARVDAALQAKPDSVELNWRGSELYAMAAQLTAHVDRRAQRNEKSQALLAKAVATVTPDNPNQVAVMFSAANAARRENDAAGAEKILLTLRQQHPDNQTVRLQYADVVSRIPGRLADAISVLEMPVKSLGAQQFGGADEEDATRVRLNTLRIRRIGTLKGDERAAAVAEVKQAIDQMSAQYGEQPIIWKLRGELQLAEGEVVQAIQSLNRAQQLIEQRGGGNDPEIQAKLAEGYILSNQTGEARRLLEQLILSQPGNLVARERLAQVLIRENNLTEAARHIEFIEQNVSNPAAVTPLKLELAQRQGRSQDVQSTLSTVSEETPAQKRAKAALARNLSNPSEVVRLIEAIGEVDVASGDLDLLVWAYTERDESDKALAAVQAALAKDPGNVRLKLAEARLRNAPAEELAALQRDVANSAEDPFQREIQLFLLARSQNRAEDALKHLKAAEAEKPEDPAVAQLLFDTYLQQKNFAEAEKYAQAIEANEQNTTRGWPVWFRLAVARGEYEKAIEIGQTMTQRLPEFSESWLLLGKAYQAKAVDLAQQQKMSEARAVFDQALVPLQRALERQSTNEEAVRSLVESYYQVNNPAEALRYIQLGQQRFPNSRYFADRFLLHQQNFGDAEQALALRQERVKERPDDVLEAAQLAATYLQVARGRLARNDTAGANRFVQDAQQLLNSSLARWPDDGRLLTVLLDLPLFGVDAKQVLATVVSASELPALQGKKETQAMLAEAYARAGQPDDAVNALREALRLSNNDVATQIQLASYLSRIERADDALAVLDANADNLDVRRQRIQVLLAAERPADAEKELNAAIAQAPTDSALLSQLGALYFFTNRLDEAGKRTDEALASNPNSELALLTRGRILLQRAQPDVPGAIRDLARLRDLSPNNAEGRFALALAYERTGDIAAAIRETEVALRLQPASRNVREQLANYYLGINPPRWADAERLIAETRAMPAFANDLSWPVRESNMWARRGDSARALSTIRAAMQQHPDSIVLLQSYLDVLLSAGENQEVLKETEKLAANSQPDLWWVHHARAIALKRLDQRDPALAEFKKALGYAAGAQNAELYIRLAQSLANEISPGEALAIITPKLPEDPRFGLLAIRFHQMADQPQEAVKVMQSLEGQVDSLPDGVKQAVLRTAGLMYSMPPTQDAARAEEAYMKLLELDPNDLAALNNLAVLLVDLAQPPRPSQAVIYSQRAIDLMNQRGQPDGLVQDTHGWVLVHIPERRLAGIDLLHEVASSRPIVDVFYHLGEAYLLDSRPTQALQYLEQAREMLKTESSGDQALPEKIEQAIGRAQQSAGGN